MAQFFYLRTRLKQWFSRTRNLFAGMHHGANAAKPMQFINDVPPVQSKEPPPSSTLQIDNASNFTIHATEDPPSPLCVAHNHPVDIYRGDGREADRCLEGLRPLTENQPNLLRIICVGIAFSDPPSVARISRVLCLPEDEVRRSIEAVATHLNSLVVFAGNIEFPPAFVSAMYRSCLHIMGASHGYIACWCLEGAMSRTRDIAYALSYWAWHVSQATPSARLATALENFPFVLCTVTEHQLSNVIHWLKLCDGLVDVSDLISQYEDRLRTLAEIPLSER
ncbi:hypothetical protein MSAN_00973100 [Mycena sanguinolenta]|uniref:Uncharacterized protein n=1 Tax=Mycena sanguinolenta TaxID=230812 RepID=A0A8H7D9E2_9AGAR|nr:hypothetical protein MSAN_00973100 [Mycena sanguinolenta]